MIHLKVFSAPWCAPCKALAPLVEQLALKGEVTVVKINIDEQPAVAAMHGVRGIPTMKLYNEDKLIKTHTGGLNLAQLEAFVKP